MTRGANLASTEYLTIAARERSEDIPKHVSPCLGPREDHVEHSHLVGLPRVRAISAESAQCLALLSSLCVGREVLHAHVKRPEDCRLFDGNDLGRMQMRRLQWYRSQVGYIQQDPYGALAPFMNVQQILQEPLIVNRVNSRRERASRLNEILEVVKLAPAGEVLPKFPHLLSGGQQQRVVIARAIILRPKLIVADEPVSMLDASVRVETLQLLKQLQQTHNLSVLYVTHDLATVRYFSERVFVMYAGEIIEKAEVHSLLDAPRHPYSRALIAAIPDPDPVNAETFREVPSGEPPSLLNPPPGCRFHPRCSSIIRGLCDREKPPEFQPRPGHFVRCWLFKK